MAYSIRLPDGTLVQNIPDELSPEAAKAKILSSRPDLAGPEKEAPFSLKDTGLAALQSAVGATKSTLQAFGAEAPGTETLGEFQQSLSKLYSPERQAEMARRDALEKAAAKSGSTLAELKTAAGAVTEAPIQATASAVGSSAPTVALSIGAATLATGAAAALGLIGAPALAFAAAVGIGTKYALGALQGAGSVKGSIYDAVKEDVAKQYPSLSKQEISKIALEAQNFTGSNWDNIMAGTAIGAVAGGTGLEKDLLKKLSKPVAAAAAKEAGEKAVEKGFVAGTKRALGAGVKEAVPEGIQGGQEQFATNVAETRAGFQTPAMEGVLGAATKEGLMGMLGGSAVTPFTGPESAPTPQQVPGQPAGGPSALEADMQAKRQALAQEQMGVQQGQNARAGEKMIDEEAKAQAQQEQVARAEAEKAAAEQLAASRAQREADLKATFPADYSDVMQRADAYAELYQEKASLEGQRKTPEVRARLATIDGLMKGIVEEDTRVPMEFQRMQKENAAIVKQLPPDLQAKYAAAAFTSNAPQQMEMREATVAQPPVQQTNLIGQPVTQMPETPAPVAPFKTVQTREEAEAALQTQRNAEVRAAQAERKAAREAGQTGLFTRVGTPSPESQTTSQPQELPVTEPTVRAKPTPETVPTIVTPEVLGVLGIGHSAVMRKADHAIQGLDIAKPEDAAQVKQMLTVYRSKPGLSAPIAEKVDAYLARPEFQGIPDVTPSAPQNQPKPRSEPRASQPSVGVPVEPTAPIVTEPGAGVPATTEQPEAPVGRGLVPIEQPATQGNVSEGTQPTPVTAEALHTQVRALEAEQQTLLTKAGRVPAVKSKARAKWDALSEQIIKKKAERDTQDTTERAAKKANEAPATEPTTDTTAPAVAPAKPAKIVSKPVSTTITTKVEKQAPAAPAETVETEKETAKPSKAVEKARDAAEDLNLDPETTKAKVKAFAKRLHKAGILDDVGLNAVESYSKDKDMGPEDMLDEIRFALDEYERQQNKAPETKQVTDESNIIEVEAKEVVPEPQRLMLEGPVDRLQDDQVEELEEFYGAKKDSAEFWNRLREDVTNYANKGAKSVAKAIRELIRQIQAGVLAVGMVFNPASGLNNDYSINVPKAFRTTIEVKAQVPDAAKAKMSTLAQGVYESMAPVAAKTGKGFIIADKPNGMLHVFNVDGSVLAQEPALYGKEKADVLGKVSSLEGGAKVTPAGTFTMQYETDTEYAGGHRFSLAETSMDGGVIAIHAAWFGDAKEKRAERLKSATAEDNRISYGCINTTHDLFLNKLMPRADEFNDGLVFVLPDATEKTGEMFKPETKTAEQKAPTEKAKSEAVRDVAKKEEKNVSTERLQKPAADLNVAERTTSVEADLQAKVAEGDVKGALQAILKAPEGTYTELDRAVARRILLSNKLPTVQIVAPGVLGMEDGKVIGGQYNAMTDTVQLTDGYVGVHTLLHELVHGFVHRAIAMHEGGKINNGGIRNLRELFDYVSKNHPELAKEYGMRDLSEFASEVMSNKNFQNALKKITYRRVNAFTAFAQSVLKVLGLASTDKHSALAAAMISVDSIMTEGRQLQESMTGTQVEGSLPGIANALVKELDPAARQSIKDIQGMFPPEDQGGVGGVLGEAVKGINKARENSGIIAAFRQAVADKHASVEAKVSQLFSQGVRDYFGNLNPMVLVRQAEDSTKIVMDFFRTGGIRLSKDGLIETTKNSESMASALQKLGEFAKANDMTVDEAKSEVSTVLEGHRLYSIYNDHNKPLEASALLLEQQGKIKEADAERAKKIDMHMSLQQIAQLEAIFQKSAGIKGILNDLNATKSQVIDLMVATGRIDKEKGQYWKDNEAYVPFNRIFEDTGPAKVFRGKGLGVLTNIPGMKGSLGRPIKNVIDSYANRLSGMVEDTMKNHAAVKVLETMEMAGFANEVATKDSAKNKGLVVSLYRDGKPVFFEVQNEYDMLAFQQAPEVINGLTTALGATSRFLRLSITAMPPFAIKQVVEDAQRAAFYSGVKRPLVVAMKTLYNMPRVFFGELTGRKSPMVRRMEALGIIGDYDFNIFEPVNEIEKELGLTKRGAGEKLFHRLEQFTKASDLAARLAVYEETMRDTNGDELLAQTRARELINFSRRGSSSAMRTAARVIPFFNAYAQGMDVLYRSATGLDASSAMNRNAARKMFLSRVAMMTALGFVYALSMSDDDGYKNATDDVRDNNWLLPNGYKISLPKELGFMFKSIPERIVGYYLRHGTDEEQTIMNALGSTLKGAMSAYGSPNVTPSFIKPILENMTNYSFFLQRELESASMQKLEPGQRSTSSTSELAKVLGESTNVSPIKIDNFLRGTFGMAGSTTLLATDAILNPTRPDRPMYQMPFGSLFLYDTIGGRAKNEFYQLQEKVSQADTTFKHLQQTDPEKAGKYLEANAALISVAPMINNSLETLSNLRRMRALYEQGTEEMLGMDGAERRAAIDELRTAENESLRYVRELQKSLASED